MCQAEVMGSRQGSDCALAYHDDGAKCPPYKRRDGRVVLNHGIDRAFVFLQTCHNLAVDLAYSRRLVFVPLLRILGTVQQLLECFQRRSLLKPVLRILAVYLETRQ